MVNGMPAHGDIIMLSLDPVKGHEQAGHRPVIVVSNDVYNSRVNLRLVCPITNTINHFPLHVPLTNTKTTGEVKCEQIRAVDLNSRDFTFIEKAPVIVTNEIADILYGSIEV